MQPRQSMHGSRGGLESKSYRVPYKYWSESLRNHKATKPAFNFGPLSALHPLSPHQLKNVLLNHSGLDHGKQMLSQL